MVRITAPEAAGAKMLVQALIGAVGAERVSLDAQTNEVCVDDRDHNQDLLGVLAVIEDWLDDAGVEAVRVKDGQRTYHMERPAHAGDRQWAPNRSCTRAGSPRSSKKTGNCARPWLPGS
jgi:hypothetical protein